MVIKGPLVRRRSDGATFEPSLPDNYNRIVALAEILSGRSKYFFRHITPAERKWWHWRRRWIRTGVIWEPKDGSEFDVIPAAEA